MADGSATSMAEDGWKELIEFHLFDKTPWKARDRQSLFRYYGVASLVKVPLLELSPSETGALYAPVRHFCHGCRECSLTGH